MGADVTRLLQAHAEGDAEAYRELVALVYEDLRRIARGQRRRVSPDASLDTTALVHEAYLKLDEHGRTGWTDRGHFLAVAATAMRQILVDHARWRLRQKRGGDVRRTTLESKPLAVAADAEQVLLLEDALGRLEREDPRLVRVFECRYFAGLSEQETADALGISLRTAQRDWLKARAWLKAALA